MSRKLVDNALKLGFLMYKPMKEYALGKSATILQPPTYLDRSLAHIWRKSLHSSLLPHNPGIIGKIQPVCNSVSRSEIGQQKEI